MQFSDLARSALEMEAVSSRTALVQILADLFRAAAAEEIALIAYLLQGRLAPAFVPLEMGMGRQQVARSIGAAFGTDPADVIARFDRAGDLGTVAGGLAAETRDAA